MRKALLFISLILFLCPLYGQKRAAPQMTVEQAVTLLEDQFDVSIIFNPRELNAAGRVSLPAQRSNAKQALESMLGEDYRVSQHGAVLTIRYQPRPAAPADVNAAVFTTAASEPAAPAEVNAAAEPVTTASEPAALQMVADDSLAEAVAEEAVVFAESSIVQAEKPADTLQHPTVSQADAASSSDIEKRKKHHRQQVFYVFSPHRLFFNVATGYGSIEGLGSVATTFDISYAWFFHRNWGVSTGAGIDCFARRLETPEQSRITDAYFPISLQMEYPLSLRTSLIGRFTDAVELPIDGTYSKDETGERYNGNTIFLGMGGEVGVAVMLVPQLSLGISLYGHGIVGSAGNINRSFTDNNICPWQIGINMSLRVNQWKKPAGDYGYYIRQKRGLR